MLKRTVTRHHKAAFEALFGIAIINAQNLYVEYNGEKVQIYQFWEKLMVGTLWTHVQAAFYGHMFKQHFMGPCSSSILRTHVQAAFYGHMFKQHFMGTCSSSILWTHVQAAFYGHVFKQHFMDTCSNSILWTHVQAAYNKTISSRQRHELRQTKEM